MAALRIVMCHFCQKWTDAKTTKIAMHPGQIPGVGDLAIWCGSCPLTDGYEDQPEAAIIWIEGEDSEDGADTLTSADS